MNGGGRRIRLSTVYAGERRWCSGREWRRVKNTTKCSLAFTRYSFTSSRLSFVHASIVLSFCRPACIAHTLLQYHCTTVGGQYKPTSLVYAIHHMMLVITISCKGQSVVYGSSPPAWRMARCALTMRWCSGREWRRAKNTTGCRIKRWP